MESSGSWSVSHELTAPSVPSLSEGSSMGVPLVTTLRWLSIRLARPVSALIAPESASMSMLTLPDMTASYPREPWPNLRSNYSFLGHNEARGQAHG